MDKKSRNTENINQVKEALYAANYRCGHSMHGPNGDIEFFVGGGSVPVIALQYHKNDDGFELWVPITQTNRMDETLEALHKATTQDALSNRPDIDAWVHNILNAE